MSSKTIGLMLGAAVAALMAAPAPARADTDTMKSETIAICSSPGGHNTGRSPEDIAELRKELEETRKALEQERSTVKIAFPEMDIVIALDTTGSMTDQVAGIRDEIAQLADLLMKLSPDAAMGLVEFKDRCDAPAVRQFDIEKLTASSLARVQSFANGMSAATGACNTDQEEALDQGLDAAIGMRWRPVAKSKVIIVISDNPAYPEAVSRTLSQAAEFRALAEKNMVATVYVPTKDSLGRDYLRRLADAGGGRFVDGGGSFTASILLALAD